MLKITVVDTIFPLGHKKLNHILIRLFPEEIKDILVVNFNNFYNKDQLPNVRLADVNLFGVYKKYTINILLQIVNYLLIFFKLFNRNNDIRIYFTFDNIAFLFANFLFFNRRNIIIHHNNTDLLQNKYHRIFFKLYMNKVEHIVFASFIKDKLIDLGVRDNKIFVIPHPISKENLKNLSMHKSESIFIGIGYASDESLFSEIIAYEEKFKILNTNNIKLVLRSKSLNYTNRNIQIITGHLTEENYESLNSNASGILCLYPKSYKYRYSGAILDGIKHKKFIIGSNIPIVNHFINIYPSLCYAFDSVEELFNLMVKLRNQNYDLDEYNSFTRYHGNENVCIAIRNMIYDDNKK